MLKASVENTLIAVMLIIQCGHFYNVRHQIYKEYDTKQFEPLHELKYTSPYHSNNWPVVLS